MLPIVSANQIFYTQLDIHKNETAEIKDIRLIEGEEKEYNEKVGSYNFIVKDDNDEVIWKQERKISWFILTNPPTPTETVPVTLRIPYYNNASVLKVEKNNKQIIKTNLTKWLCSDNDGTCSNYCSGKEKDPDCTCGDGVCQSFEDIESCSQDCLGNDDEANVNNENNINSSGTGDGGSGSGFNLSYLLIILFVFVLFVLYYFSGF